MAASEGIRKIERAVVLAVGSGGDVAPMAAIAGRLAERGLQTTLLAPVRYKGYTQGSAVSFQSIGADPVFEAVFDGEEIWHPTKGLAASWRYYGAAMRTGLAALRDGWQAQDTVLVSSSFAVAARLAEECHGFLNTTVHLSPSVIFSALAPAKWPEASIPHGWPLFLKRWMLAVAERLVTDKVIGAEVNPFRRELGLAPEQRLFSTWIHSRQRVIYAFPEWFAAAAVDWPANGRFAGFPNGIHGTTRMPDKLRAFLEHARRPLVVVTAGTAVTSRPLWVRRITEFALAKGAHVVLVEPEPSMQADSSCSVAFAPFEQLFRRADLVVHHAGIGTLAEAIRAGIPQFLVPTAHDQVDNAAHLEALGVARVIDPGRGTAGVEEAWRWAFDDGDTLRSLSKAQQKIGADADGAARTADIVLADVRNP